MIVEPAYMDELVYDAKSHTYRVGGRLIPHITEIVPSDYSHVPPRVLEKARQRGTAVHRATELYDQGLLNWSTLDPRLVGYLEAWVKARAEYEIEFEFADIERRLYHPIDCYGGTGDRPRAWITPPGKHRRLATIEIKSIAKMDENVALQTAGQQRCENYRARALGIPETVDRWGIQLKRNGKYFPVPYTDKRHERVFLSYTTTLNWEVLHGKREYAIQGTRVQSGAGNIGNGSGRNGHAPNSAGSYR
jgi:hypothetical protein